MEFIENRCKDFPVHSTFRCQSCGAMTVTNNYVLTVIKIFRWVGRGILEISKGWYGGGG